MRGRPPHRFGGANPRRGEQTGMGSDEASGFDEKSARKQKTRHGGRVFSGAVASPCTRECDVAERRRWSRSGGARKQEWGSDPGGGFDSRREMKRAGIATGPSGDLVEAAGVEPASADHLILVLHAYPALFFLVITPPEGQGMRHDQLRFGLTPGPETRPDAILLSDPESEAQARPVGSRLVFTQPERSCRRWQLTWLQPGFTRIAASSACPRVRPIHVEARTPPVSECFYSSRPRPGPEVPSAGASGYGRSFKSRFFCRFQSRSFSVRRLSCCFLPLARAISTLTFPFFQYMAVGTSV